MAERLAATERASRVALRSGRATAELVPAGGKRRGPAKGARRGRARHGRRNSAVAELLVQAGRGRDKAGGGDREGWPAERCGSELKLLILAGRGRDRAGGGGGEGVPQRKQKEQQRG